MDILHDVLGFAAKGFVVFATVAATVLFCLSVARRKRPAGSRLRVEQLNRLYCSEPALHEIETDPAGFEWVDCNDTASSVISLLRKGKRQTIRGIELAEGAPLTVCDRDADENGNPTWLVAEGVARFDADRDAWRIEYAIHKGADYVLAYDSLPEELRGKTTEAFSLVPVDRFLPLLYLSNSSQLPYHWNPV